MNIALFGKTDTDAAIPYIQELVDALDRAGWNVVCYAPFYDSLRGRLKFARVPELFTRQSEITGRVDFLFSIGGDGTILDAIHLAGDSDIPITGINLGRLGFLSSIQKEQILPALDAIANGRYQLENRTLLRLDAPGHLFEGNNHALNDLTVYKPNVMSLLTIKTWINDEFLNTYWADGLIIATPTGSTAYSLSCTGPIVTPGSENFLITPIASHNLTVRPIIIRDDATIRIRVEGNNPGFLVSLDSRTASVDRTVELVVRKASYRIRLLRLNEKDFFQTIREKLNWGLDNRN